MLKKKNRNIAIIPLVLLLGVLMFPVFSPSVAEAQAGCGNEMGPPAPGTVCPDGSVPLRDPTLPIGCPGSSQQGPRDPNAEVNCPSRPGRPDCRLRESLCVDSAGNNVTNGVSGTRGVGYETSDVQADCTEGTDAENCGITRYIVLVINVLSALAGIVIAGSIAYGGIQYSMSGSDPQRVSEAKDRIRNAVIALVFFIFGYAFLNYLIPGGVL